MSNEAKQRLEAVLENSAIQDYPELWKVLALFDIAEVIREQTQTMKGVKPDELEDRWLVGELTDEEL